MIFSYIDPVCKRLNLYFCCEESWWKLAINTVFWLEEVHHIYRFGFLNPRGGPGGYKHIMSQALMADTASSSAAWPQPLRKMIYKCWGQPHLC